MADYELQNGTFYANGVLINKKPSHLTDPKVIALAKMPDGTFKKVALTSSKEIDNKNYFPYSAAKDVDVPKYVTPVATENTITESEDSSTDKDPVNQTQIERFLELKAQKAWLKPNLKGEYLELKNKLS